MSFSGMFEHTSFVLYPSSIYVQNSADALISLLKSNVQALASSAAYSLSCKAVSMNLLEWFGDLRIFKVQTI